MTDPTLDEQLAEIETLEAGRTAKAKTTELDDTHVMQGVIVKAMARAERAHRLATEPAQIKSYPC